jgi:hypothetical protein
MARTATKSAPPGSDRNVSSFIRPAEARFSVSVAISPSPIRSMKTARRDIRDRPFR